MDKWSQGPTSVLCCTYHHTRVVICAPSCVSTRRTRYVYFRGMCALCVDAEDAGAAVVKAIISPTEVWSVSRATNGTANPNPRNGGPTNGTAVFQFYPNPTPSDATDLDQSDLDAINLIERSSTRRSSTLSSVGEGSSGAFLHSSPPRRMAATGMELENLNAWALFSNHPFFAQRCAPTPGRLVC